MRTPPDDFRAFSAMLGADPLQVQGPGGNTSIKAGGVMWIKASGTELSDAQSRDIFVAVDRAAALAQAHRAGDGTCKDTVLDPAHTLRPSIETTFHAFFAGAVVAHTHSVATLVHAISPEGRAAMARKLAGLGAVYVPYEKPGLPLTQAIMARATADTQIVILENHGLICAGDTVGQVRALIAQVEALLAMPRRVAGAMPQCAAPDGYRWVGQATLLATDPRLAALVRGGSYYPDHVVFLGPSLPVADGPAIIVKQTGIALRTGATPAQAAMVHCLADVLYRLPDDWSAHPIGPQAEAALLDWDAEKYRQALAARSAHD
jgi:rhamnose utilization protein RhaD (predicted bifunctional aldolase and dehydrogenase)